LGRANARPL